MTGLFITFEGPDGAGKTTQINRLANEISKLNKKIVFTREPGGTRIGDKIRSIILDPEHAEMVNQAEVLLYAASRAQHVHEKIIPALNEGCIVLCDRFIDASVAYQGYGLGVTVDMVLKINHFASSGLMPTRTYMLDIPAEESLKRLHKRASGDEDAGLDRIEQRKLDYHQTVREAFRRIAQEQNERVLLVQADRTEQEIATDIAADFYLLLDHHNK